LRIGQDAPDSPELGMDKSMIAILSGLCIAALAGHELLIAYRTGATRFRRSHITRTGRGRIGFSHKWATRTENPKVFWRAVWMTSGFFVLGLAIAGWAIIAPDFFR
jgi:hypothetical protein